MQTFRRMLTPISTLRCLAMLQTFVLLASVAFAHTDRSPDYKLCKQQNGECKPVNFIADNETKGEGCRAACAKQRGDLNEKMTVYFCEGYNKTCKPYEVFGRSGYAENFERHTMCVNLCHFVAKVEHSSEENIKIYAEPFYDYFDITRINGTFNDLNKCTFKCDGWPKLKNSQENTAIFCPTLGDCTDVKFFSSGKAANAFAGLEACLTKCMSRISI